MCIAAVHTQLIFVAFSMQHAARLCSLLYHEGKAACLHARTTSSEWKTHRQLACRLLAVLHSKTADACTKEGQNVVKYIK